MSPKLIALVVIGDLDCGLCRVPQTFCANGLVGLVTGSHVSVSGCAGDLVWFLVGLPVPRFDLSLC